MAMGAALSFKTLGRQNVVVAYVRQGEVGKGVWRRVLGLASKLELPMIFVVLPAGRARRGRRGESEREDGAVGGAGNSCRCGRCGGAVPGGAGVAGTDSGGDGPVLIECVEFRVEGKGGCIGRSAGSDEGVSAGPQGLHEGVAGGRGRMRLRRRIAAAVKQ